MRTRGIIFDIKKFAVHDGPGIRTTVFFKGCPLSCQWCHNPESMRLLPEKIDSSAYRKCSNLAAPDDHGFIGKEVAVEEIIDEIKKDIVFYDESTGGVTISGGEPLMQPHFLQALLKACKDIDVHTAVDTSGFVQWKNFEKIISLTDVFLFDLKLMDETEHKKYTGVGNGLIHDNLKKLHKSGAAINVRVPLIPGITDTEKNLTQIKEFLARLPNIRNLSLLPYNPIGESKYTRFKKKQSLGPLKKQSEHELEKFKNIFHSSALKVKIGG